MKNIIYFNPSDATKFEFDRFKKSLNEYAKVPADEIKQVLKEFDQYENLHVSRLVEAGVALIAKHSDEETAKQYFEAHDAPHYGVSCWYARSLE